jgi:hypothetical protein
MWMTARTRPAWRSAGASHPAGGSRSGDDGSTATAHGERLAVREGPCRHGRNSFPMWQCAKAVIAYRSTLDHFPRSFAAAQAIHNNLRRDGHDPIHWDRPRAQASRVWREHTMSSGRNQAGRMRVPVWSIWPLLQSGARNAEGGGTAPRAGTMQQSRLAAKIGASSKKRATYDDEEHQGTDFDRCANACYTGATARQIVSRCTQSSSRTDADGTQGCGTHVRANGRTEQPVSAAHTVRRAERTRT